MECPCEQDMLDCSFCWFLWELLCQDWDLSYFSKYAYEHDYKSPYVQLTLDKYY